MQLVAPVKLRPFKSAYTVRQGQQLRIACQAQRGFPAAQISWYVGNQLVDGDFLRARPDEFQVLQLSGGQLLRSGDQPASAARQLVEINPVPASRHQMQLTPHGRGQWLEYGQLPEDKRYAIETEPEQYSYMQMKLKQLTATGGAGSSGSQLVGSGDAQLGGQAALSVLAISSLDLDRHTTRFACRATGRANTDEVTTVVRVQGKSTLLRAPANSLCGSLFWPPPK